MQHLFIRPGLHFTAGCILCVWHKNPSFWTLSVCFGQWNASVGRLFWWDQRKHHLLQTGPAQENNTSTTIRTPPSLTDTETDSSDGLKAADGWQTVWLQESRWTLHLLFTWQSSGQVRHRRTGVHTHTHASNSAAENQHDSEAQNDPMHLIPSLHQKMIFMLSAF